MIRLVLSLLLVSTVAHADALSGVHGHAVRRTGSIRIDGHLEESAWAHAPRQSGFIQRFPKDGAPASCQTSFAILYDDAAIYVGVWADDPEPDKIRALLTRRDVDGPSDAIAIGFDSYHDRRTAFVFQLNAAGVQRDMLLFDDQNQDDSWDAVWTGDAAITPDGWTAEFRIPLNQLRFSADDNHDWGFQIVRTVARTQEQSSWSPWPRSSQHIVSKFGVLDGIEHLRPGRRMELLPYALGGVAVEPVEAGDPLNGHVSARRGFGLDLKYGLGSAFTLSATLNPDFGQVEADPSQINLSANELFFAEKRPFFLEGVDLFQLPIGNGDGNTEGAFYSRRIGAAPAAPDGDYTYLRAPSSTAIYGAAKLTGKTPGGWSVGMLDAVTGEETAAIADSTGTRSEPLVAPLTNYAVARVKRDLRDGKTAVGASATAVDRAVAGTPLAATMHDQAYTTGLQVQHRWDDDAWLINVHTLGSWVHGSEDAIAATQQNSRHYFQRPDATHVHFDPTRTSLSGLAATWMAGRLGATKHWRVGTGGDLRTPGLELNDLGFQNGTDHVIPFLWGEYREDEPSGHVLNWSASSDVFLVSTLEPRLAVWGLECNGHVQLSSYWQISGGCNLANGRWDPNALRGGPALRGDSSAAGWLSISSDNRKRVWLSLQTNASHDFGSDAVDAGVSLGATIQARSNIDLFVGPTFYARTDPMQYIDQVDDTSGRRHYVFGTIQQTTAAMTLRLNWTFSPHLSLQAYAQPFVAAGRYSQLKDVDHPHATTYADRFHLLQGNDYQEMDGVIHVTYGGTYSFDRPDFDLRQLRSTLVMRWEYRPGSSVYAIWSHGRSDTSSDGRFRLGRDLSALAGADGEDVVMVKANYWIGL